MSDDLDRLAQLRGKVEKLQAEAVAMSENRKAKDMTAEEIARLEEIESEVTYLREQIEARERIDRLAAMGAGDPPPRGTTRRTAPDPVSSRHYDPTFGFDHLGEFTQAVMMSGRPRATVDERLARMAPSSWSGEDVGSDGGYLVPPEFSAQVMEYVGAQGSIYSLVRRTPVNHHLAIPVDEESPWSTSGPVAYWEGEADQYAQSKLKIRSAAAKLNKLVALCPVTDELMEDAPQLGAYLQSVIAKKLRWKVDFSIIQGTGAGMPLGILNAPCLKSVAAEGSQTADTINSTNVLKMFSACFGEFRSNSVWLHNQDCETQLWTMVVAGSSSDVPVYLPSGTGYAALAGAPYSMLMGRPAIPHQACETLGDHGDILLGDFSQYILGEKTSGPNFASSIHLWFDYGLTAVRATWRVCGMPLWSTTIAARDGSATYSPFVSLAARA